MQSGGLKREPAIHPEPATSALFTTPYGSTFSSTSSDAFENIRSFTGTFQMAVRAFGNHQTTPPISPAKRGAVMSPLHEGSVNSVSWSTGWHTNCVFALHAHRNKGTENRLWWLHPAHICRHTLKLRLAKTSLLLAIVILHCGQVAGSDDF